MAENPLDESVLDRLVALEKGRPGFAGKIVALYLDTTPSVLHELESAALADDKEALRVASHRLRSASLVIGAMPLASSCHELDRMLRTGEMGDAAGFVRIIGQEYRQAEAALRSWWNRLPGRC